MLKHIFYLRIGVLFAFAIEMAALCSLNIEKPTLCFRSGEKLAYEVGACSTGIKRWHSAL